MSTTSWSTPDGGSRRSSTTGQPRAAATAHTTAAPSPDAPPVTSTLPTSVITIDLLDESGRGATLQVRHHDDLAVPGAHHGLFGDAAAAVVVALHEQRRA